MGKVGEIVQADDPVEVLVDILEQLRNGKSLVGVIQSAGFFVLDNGGAFFSMAAADQADEKDAEGHIDDFVAESLLKLRLVQDIFQLGKAGLKVRQRDAVGKGEKLPVQRSVGNGEFDIDEFGKGGAFRAEYSVRDAGPRQQGSAAAGWIRGFSDEDRTLAAGWDQQLVKTVAVGRIVLYLRIFCDPIDLGHVQTAPLCSAGTHSIQRFPYCSTVF